MAIALDLIILLIIVFTIIGAAKKGFIAAVFDFLKFIVSVIVAWIFKGHISTYIMGTEIFSGAKESVTQSVTTAFANAGENISAEEMLGVLTEENPGIVKLMQTLGISYEKIESWIENTATSGSENAASYAVQHIIEPAAKICSDVIAFIVIFIVSLIALWICQKILCKIFELPVLRQFNRLGGVIIGIICAFLYVSLFVSIGSALISNSGLFGVELPQNTVESTVLFEFFNENNLFSYIGALFDSSSNTIV